MKALDIRGLPAYYATMAFHKLMFGLKMLPNYAGETYEEFYKRMDGMSESDQENLIRSAALFVKLEKEEFFDLVQFAADANGVPYNESNTKSLKPEEIHELIVFVSKRVAAEHKARLLSDAEKKN